ncbi:hypothetical protein [uncultured Clostridium sp.]|uniref:hypothetical protein n=1 Tax=uncultured Clostridium sp. TaxID=59620 RepID=UPI00260B5755|nr:hypothetical protein [uncultured Clostridium sp.]
MLSCENCKNSYRTYIENYIGCNIVDKYKNIPLRILGLEGKCPYCEIKNNMGIGEKVNECDK